MFGARTGRSQSARPAAALALLSASLFAAPALATTVRGLSLYEKAQVAQTIVRAEVLSVSPRWEREGHSAETIVTLRVTERLKGALELGSKFELRQAGGRIGEFVHEVPGMSPFQVGEDVLLFLEPYERYQVEIGVGIGKYGIEKSPTGALQVTHDPKVALVFERPDGALRIEEARPMTPERLDKFLARLRSYVSGERRPSPAANAPPTLRPTLIQKPVPAKN